MKNLLTVAFIVTMLYGCGGEFQLQDKAPADNAAPTEHGAMEQAAVERPDSNNKQPSETTKQTATEAKTDSAIEMAIGLARSMF